MFKNCKIEGKSEHVLNRKPRINGEVVSNSEKLSLTKSCSRSETKKKIENLFYVLNECSIREGNTNKDLKIEGSGKEYNLVIGNNSEVFNIDKINPGVFIKIKGFVKRSLNK